MTVKDSLSMPIWRLDPSLVLKGAGTLRGVRAVPDDVWAVGITADPDTGHARALVVRWHDGLTIVPPAPADPDADVLLTAVDATDDEIWAVGSVTVGDTGTRPRVERYQRSAKEEPGEPVFCPSPNGDGTLRGVAMLSPVNGWAVGGSDTETFVVRWNGKEWRQVPSPNPGSLTAVAANTDEDAWAVGNRVDETSGRTVPLVLHWDGATWTEIPTPVSPTGNDELLGVAVIAPDDVWAVGTNRPDLKADEDARQVAFALHWDGWSWQTVSAPLGVTQFSAVSAKSATAVWFAGYSQLPGGPETAHIEFWDGTKLTDDFGWIAQTRGDVASALSAISAETSRLVAVGWRLPTASSSRQPAAFFATG